jgi:hypothetical protein
MNTDTWNIPSLTCGCQNFVPEIHLQLRDLNGDIMKHLLQLLTLIGVSFIASCGNQPSAPVEPVAPLTTDLLIPPTTKVLDAQTQKSLNVYDKTGVLKFSSDATMTFEPGQVLVSTPTPVASQGFLRRIKTVRREGNQVILETEQAKIIDAIHGGTAQFKQPLVRAITSKLQAKDSKFTLNIDSDFGTGGKLKIKGSVVIDPILELSMGIGCNRKTWGICTEIPDLNITTRLGLNESLNIKLTGDVSSNFDKTIELDKITFQAIKFSIGPVPIVIVPRIRFYLGAQGKLSAKLETSISQDALLVAGFKYNSDDGFKNLSERTVNSQYTRPRIDGAVDVKAVAGASFELMFYDVLGPYGEIEAGPRLQLNPTGIAPNNELLKLDACLWLNIGVKIDIIIYKDNWETEIFRSCLSMAVQSNRPPLAIIIEPRSEINNVYTTLNTKLVATAEDPDLTATTCRWESSIATDPFPKGGCDTNVVFATAGTRNLTLRVTDASGTVSSQTLPIVVKAAPEVPVRILEPKFTVFSDTAVITVTNNQNGKAILAAEVLGGTAPLVVDWMVAYPVTKTGIEIPQIATKRYSIGQGTALDWDFVKTLSLKEACDAGSKYAKFIVTATDSRGFIGKAEIVGVFLGCVE